MKNEKNNIEENFIDLDEEIEEILNGSKKNIKSFSDMREDMKDELNEFNSTAIERFLSIETLINSLDSQFKTQTVELKTQKDALKTQKDELKTQKDALRTQTDQLKSLKTSLSSDILSLNKTLERTFKCDLGWLKFENNCFKLLPDTISWTSSMCNRGVYVKRNLTKSSFFYFFI